MNFNINWIQDLEEFLCDFILYESSEELFSELIEKLGFTGAYKKEYETMSLAQLIFLKGVEEEVYSQEEISIIESGEIAIIASNSFSKEELKFIYIRLSCTDKDSIKHACAIIKILNKAFKDLHCILFHIRKKIAFGCYMSGGKKPYDNFGLSKWFSVLDVETIVENFSYDAVFGKSIIDTYNGICEAIIRYSCFDVNYNEDLERDTRRQYLNLLSYITSQYRLDMYYEVYKCINNLLMKVAPDLTYRKVSDELQWIVSEQLSSYEYLALAEEAESKIQNQKSIDITYHMKELDDPYINKIKNISDEIFSNAEDLLKYMDKE